MNLNITKRQKIILTAILLTIGLISTQLVDFNLRFKFIAGLMVSAYFLSLWSLWEGMDKTKAFVLMILPTFFTVAVASVYFLLPIRWLTRLPVALSFGLTFYLLLLAQNVFNVASIRTIPLYRAASTASFLFTLLSAFFLYNVVYAFNLLFIWNAITIFLISLPLILQVLWTIEMKDKISIVVFIQSLILSLILAELAFAFSFWPLKPTIWSLALSSTMYILVGLSTQVLKDRVTKRVVWEYMGIGMAVLLISLFATSWTG